MINNSKLKIILKKNCFLKMNNSFFGKTIQNARKHQFIRASLNEKDTKTYLSSLLLERFEIVNEDFVLFKMKKAKLMLDKPIYVGFTVLELSKLRMYELYYRYFKKIYKENCELIYTDTDSLFLNIKCDNVYDDIKHEFADIIDFFNFSKNDKKDCENNNGKLGYLKSETISPIKSFIGLEPKMYIYVLEDNTTKKTAKGCKKSNLKNFTFETYKDILLSNSLIRTQQFSII